MVVFVVTPSPKSHWKRSALWYFVLRAMLRRAWLLVVCAAIRASGRLAQAVGRMKRLRVRAIGKTPRNLRTTLVTDAITP
jgi:hypothetical protein